MEQFKREGSGFNYVFEHTFAEEGPLDIVLEMPSVSPNKRSVADIAWQSEGGVLLYATIASKPDSVNAMWQQINPGEAINGAVTALKISGDVGGKIIIRVIMN